LYSREKFPILIQLLEKAMIRDPGTIEFDDFDINKRVLSRLLAGRLKPEHARVHKAVGHDEMWSSFVRKSSKNKCVTKHRRFSVCAETTKNLLRIEVLLAN
jgi:hypothetical protein